MSKQKIDRKKLFSWLIGFGLAKVLYDYVTIGQIDTYGVIGIPIIALGLIYIVDRNRLMHEED